MNTGFTGHPIQAIKGHLPGKYTPHYHHHTHTTGHQIHVPAAGTQQRRKTVT